MFLHGGATWPRNGGGGACSNWHIATPAAASTAIPIRRAPPPLHIARSLRTPGWRPRCNFARKRDVHARERADERVVEVLLRVLDEDLDAELGQAVVEEERAGGGHEVVVLHPCELRNGQEIGF